MSETTLKKQAIADNITYNSLYRQAIINGNFDVWQRGTSGTPSGTYFLADRFFDYLAGGGGTLPTLTRSRQTLTPGELDGSFYYSRLTTNGAGSSLGTSAIGEYETRLEGGTRYLCGNGKKVTLSFYAKSDIADKKIGILLKQNYGTGGSPTSQEIINGTNWTLTSTWTKYTHTFTTNTLASKTFGTNNDDFIGLLFVYMWNTDWQAYLDDTGVEDFGGAGNIDIAQVQLCAGEVALPFMPKSFEEELRACQRYYEHSYNYGTYPGSTSDVGEVVGQASVAINASTSGALVTPCHGTFKVTKRAIPTVVLYGRATANAIFVAGGVARGGATAQGRGMTIVCGYITLDTSSAVAIGDRSQIQYHWTASAEL